MAIPAGTRLGPYEVLSAIGAGGMGEVYRARDSKLGRDVALKVLLSAFAANAERMARFQREARVLAALNHPNIAHIYGLEESSGSSALVMELVEGPTLADRIAAGPIPLDEALPLAKQIAEALEYAHEQGVIHRDLKPANIKVKPDGTVKVLDFGLAKALTEDPAAVDMSNSPTLSMAATMQGVILGTAAYMSPEQARGKSVDRRTDIWAFGCLLYEMLSGKQVFHDEDVSDILAAVIRAEPDWTALPGGIPVSIRVLLQRCLRKDRRLRLGDASAIRIEIDDALALPKDARTPSTAASSKSKLMAAVAAVATVIAITLGALFWRGTRPSEPRPLLRFDVDLGPDVSLGSVRGTDAILSPDGTRLVYVSQGRLFARRLDQPKAVELAGTDGAFAPFFSPDGQWVAFFTGSNLKKISIDGGTPLVLCDAHAAYGGNWGEDGNFIASLSASGTLWRIPSAGGTPTPVSELAPGEVTQRWPQVLPGAKAVLFTSFISNELNVEVMSLRDRRRKTLQRGGTFGRYVATSNGVGYLLYMHNDTLFAVAFDLDTLEVRGTPVPVLDQVANNPGNRGTQFDISKTGMLLYRSGGAAVGGLVTMQWLDGVGKMQPLLAKPGNYLRPRISPDGQRVALEVAEGAGRDVWIYDWQRDNMTRLTFDVGGSALAPVWSPDGRYIVFMAKGGISFTRSDGASKPQPLTQSQNLLVPFSFTPDGKRLAFNQIETSGIYSIWTMAVESDDTGLRGGKPELFLQESFDGREPMFSSDGRWLAYTSNESGTYQVYVRAFPNKGGKWQISNAGGAYPVWSHDGQELFFRSNDDQIMVASYTVKGDSFVVDKPKAWSEKRLADFGTVGIASYDLARDGKRIAALMAVEAPDASQVQNHVIFLENFLDELQRKLPLSGQ